MHGPAACAQPFAQSLEVRATLHEHGDRLFGVTRPFLREDLDDARSFRVWARHCDRRKPNELTGCVAADSRAGTECGDPSRNPVFCRKHALAPT